MRLPESLRIVESKFDLPLHREHFGTPRSDVSPASFRRSIFSAGEAGHPSLAFSRRGLSEK